jgi:predicted dienelactone hydrolase
MDIPKYFKQSPRHFNDLTRYTTDPAIDLILDLSYVIGYLLLYIQPDHP